MNSELIAAALILVIIVFAGIGISCQRSGESYGRKIGFRDGHAEGWNDAHNRIADALDVEPAALSIALIEMESAKSLAERRAALADLFKAAA